MFKVTYPDMGHRLVRKFDSLEKAQEFIDVNVMVGGRSSEYHLAILPEAAISRLYREMDELWQDTYDDENIIVDPMTELPGCYRFQVPGTFETDRGTLTPDGQGGWIVTWDEAADTDPQIATVSNKGVVQI